MIPQPPQTSLEESGHAGDSPDALTGGAAPSSRGTRSILPLNMFTTNAIVTDGMMVCDARAGERARAHLCVLFILVSGQLIPGDRFGAVGTQAQEPAAVALVQSEVGLGDVPVAFKIKVRQ